MSDRDGIEVREMQLSEVDMRIDYFHTASDEHLEALGVDRRLLPDRAAWNQLYADDFARPLLDRANYSLIWLLSGEAIGFSSVDRIEFGSEAFMHLHIIKPPRRRSGLGVEFVRRSTIAYFRELKLRRLYCEPKAVNVAPNRTLQAAGFRYLFSHHTTPGPLNYPQIATRWVLEATDAV